MNYKYKIRFRGLNYFAIVLLGILSGCATTTKVSHPDFSGVWEITEYDEVVRPEENAKYTDEVLRREAMFNENFDTVHESHAIFCDTTGMPWTMLGRARNYPREIFQTESRIVFFMEYMDQVRQIHLDKTEIPDQFPGTRQGYSIGHWEGDDLVIETAGFTETTEPTIYHRSGDAKITERWRLVNHPKYGEALEVTIDMVDPEFYQEPVHARTLWQRASEGTVLGAYACPRTLWEDFVTKRLREKKK